MSSKTLYSVTPQAYCWYDCPVTLAKYKRKAKVKRKMANHSKKMNRKRK